MLNDFKGQGAVHQLPQCQCGGRRRRSLRIRELSAALANGRSVSDMGSAASQATPDTETSGAPHFAELQDASTERSSRGQARKVTPRQGVTECRRSQAVQLVWWLRSQNARPMQ